MLTIIFISYSGYQGCGVGGEISGSNCALPKISDADLDRISDCLT